MLKESERGRLCFPALSLGGQDRTAVALPERTWLGLLAGTLLQLDRPTVSGVLEHHPIMAPSASGWGKFALFLVHFL